MQYFPLNIKLSYSERLDIQLFIRHQFQSQKFKRHWIFCQEFSNEDQNKILKAYLSFINQGDLYKIKTSSYSGNWRQKTFEDATTVLGKESITDQRKHYRFNLQKEFSTIRQQATEKEYDQLIIVSIFMSQAVGLQKMQQFCEYAESFESSEVILNIFVPENYVEKIIPTRTWLRVYTLNNMKQQVRGLFSTLSRTLYKKITIELRCLDGDVSINESSQNLAKKSWRSQISEDFTNEYISNTVYFPSSNSPYIMSAEIKNMLKQQVCRFQIVMMYEDEAGKVGKLSKAFSLKPTKQFMDWTDNASIMNENQSFSRYQQLSLNFDEVDLNQKLNFMKIMGTPVRVVIKNRSEV